MQVTSVANHSFSIPKQSSIREEALSFVKDVLADKTTQKNLRRFAHSLLLDITRPEFPTKTVRDVLTGYTIFTYDTMSLLKPNDTATYELISKQLYTIVAFGTNTNDPFGRLQTSLKQFCRKKKYQAFYDNTLSENVVIDLLAEPLERLPYARSAISGKHIPRIIVDNKGRVYDHNGIIVKSLKYDVKASVLTDEKSKIRYAVPYISCEQSFPLTTLFNQCVSLSWLYGQLVIKKEVSYEVEQLFLRSFNQRPIFEQTDSFAISFPALFPIEFVFGDSRDLPTSINFHACAKSLGRFDELQISMVPKDNTINFYISHHDTFTGIKIQSY